MAGRARSPRNAHLRCGKTVKSARYTRYQIGTLEIREVFEPMPASLASGSDGFPRVGDTQSRQHAHVRNRLTRR
jgi:hypothetical protein